MAAKRIKVPKGATRKADDIPGMAERLQLWVTEHLRVLGGFLAGIVAVLLISWGYGVYDSAGERRALTEYAEIFQKWADAAGPEAAEARRDELIRELEGFVAANSGTRAARNALVDLSRLCFEAGRYDDALKWQKRALKEADGKAGTDLLVRYQMGLTLEALDRKDEAIASWRLLSESAPAEMRREALWHVGKNLEAKGETAEALECYEKAAETSGFYPGEDLLDETIARLRREVSSGSSSGETGEEAAS